MYCIVAYDRRTGVDYSPLLGLLESFHEHWHLQEAVWIVGPVASAHGLANEVAQRLDEKDLLIVQQLTEECAWLGYTTAGDTWLRNRAQRSTDPIG